MSFLSYFLSHNSVFWAENYVYDLYAMDDEANENEQDSFTGYPL